MTTFAGHWGPEGFADERGNARPDAAVYVYETGTTTPITLYADRDRSATITNPLPTDVGPGEAGLDSSANGDFYAEPGIYRMVVKVGGVDVFDDTISVPLDAEDSAAPPGAEPIATAHLADTVDAHDASAVSFVPDFTLVSTDVQAAIVEAATGADSALNAHIGDATDAHDASAVSFVPDGSIAATDVQAAIVEVRDEAAALGSGYQPLDSDLTAIAALSTTAYGRALLELADAAAGRSALGLGTAATANAADFQPVDSDLTAIAALTTTSYGRAFLALVDAAAGRTALGLGTVAVLDTGTGAANVPTISIADARYQPLDSDLTAIAALATTSYGRALLTLADAAAGRSALGLGTAAVEDAGVADGVATLDGSGLVPVAQLPATVISDVFVVASQAAMLALTAQRGDLAIRTDLNKTFALSTDSPGTLADWKELLTPTDAVLSVDGRTGAVTLSDLYQPLDSDLTSIAALSTTSYGRSLLTVADASALRTLGGLVIGTDVEAWDADLDAIKNLSPSNDDVIQRKAGAWTNRTMAQLATDLGLAASYQPLDADLTAIAALTTTSFGRSVLEAANAAALRTLADSPSNAEAILDAIVDAKGDLIAGTAADTVARLGVGANDTMLMAASGQSTGLKWATPSEIRTALALVIGTNVQAWDADLDAIAALGVTNDSIIQGKGGVWAKRTLAQLMTDLAALGTTFQPLDSDLTTIAGLTATTDSVMQAKSSAWSARTLAQFIADLGALGTTFQPLDSDLTAIAALSTTAFGRSLLAAADAAALRTLAGATFGQPPDVQVFLASGTWTKPTDVSGMAAYQHVDVICLGGGGGGGGGRRGASGTARGGGGGGGGGGNVVGRFAIGALASTETVTVGAGGTAGAAGSADDTNGSAGGDGGVSRFASTKSYCLGTYGGSGGAGGTTAGGAGGSGLASAFGSSFYGVGTGGTGGAAGAPTAGAVGYGHASGGGGGGGLTTGNAAANGALGWMAPSFTASDFSPVAYGVGGVVGGASPTTAQQAPVGSPIWGGGGGGGASSVAGAAQAGATGGRYGGGAGGGGASVNGQTAGAGGVGGAGIVVAITR